MSLYKFVGKQVCQQLGTVKLFQIIISITKCLYTAENVNMSQIKLSKSVCFVVKTGVAILIVNTNGHRMHSFNR